MDLLPLNRYMFDHNMDFEDDPVTISKEMYNQSIVENKEALLQAINERKEKVLGVALNIFNKL